MISDGIEKANFVITIWKKNIDGRGAQLPLSSFSNQPMCTWVYCQYCDKFDKNTRAHFCVFLKFYNNIKLLLRYTVEFYAQCWRFVVNCWNLPLASLPISMLILGLCPANYANPVYGVATICHQVRCLRWGHPSLFHTATSPLIWYKMFCMRDMSYRLTWMKFINMLSVYAQSGTHRRVNWWITTGLT